MKFDINLPCNPYGASIKIDGKELNRVTSLKIEASAEEVPVITLKIIPDEINITGDGWRVNTKDSIEDDKESKNEIKVVVKVDAESAKEELKEIENTTDRIIGKQKQFIKAD